MFRIVEQNGELVDKDACRFPELHAMLALILGRLLPVPLEPQLVHAYTVTTQ